VNFFLLLVGARAMTAEQFREYRRKTVVGIFLRVSLPLGNYDDTKLVNLGSNRWHFAPGLAISHSMGRWTVDAASAAWLFTANESFFGGNVLEQEPIVALQLNVAYNFRPGMWLAAGVRQTFAGRSTLNGVSRDDPIENNRVGLVFGVPLDRHHSLKAIATTGVRATKGTDFNTLAVQWFVNY